MKVEIDPVKLAIHISGIKKERLTEDEDDDEGAVENNPETWEEDDMLNFARSNNNAGGVQTINFCGDTAGHNYQVFSVDSSSGPDDMEAVSL